MTPQNYTKANTLQLPSSGFNPSVAQGLSINSSGQAQGGYANPPAATVAGLLTGGISPTKTASGGTAFNPASLPSTQTAPTGYTAASGGIPAAAQTNQATGGNAVIPTAPAPYTVDNKGAINGGFQINTSGSIPSNALSSTATYGDANKQLNQYQDYVNGLFKATQPSQDYLGAIQQYNDAQLRNATIQTNYQTDPNFPGETTGQAGTFYNRQSALGNLAQQTAQNNLQLQQAIRSGNIDAYKALVGAAQPTGVSPGSSLVSPLTGQTTFGGSGAYSDYQAQQTYYNLAQNFPDANIPSYNPQLGAQQNLQIAQQAASQSPSFQSRNLVPVQLPGGGYSFVNKNQLVTGDNGQVQIISSGDAAQADAYKTSIGTLQNQQSQIQSQISTVDNNFPLLLNIVQKYGLNSSLPLLNQFQNLADQQLGQTGITQLNAVATGLKATIAQIVSRGGSVDNQTRNEANALLPTNATWGVLNDLYKTVKAEGAGVIKGINDEKQKNISGLNSIYGGASSPGGGSSTGGGASGGYIDPSQAVW